MGLPASEVAPFESLVGVNCESLLGNPEKLDLVLECEKQNKFDKGYLGSSERVCAYLEVAIQYIRSDNLDETKSSLLLSALVHPLPFYNYIDSWLPAIKQEYLKGRISKEQLVNALFPLHEKPGLFLAYQEEMVEDYYVSLLDNEEIKQLPINLFRNIGTVEEAINALLKGDLAKVVISLEKKGYFEPGAVSYDLNIKCEPH